MIVPDGPPNSEQCLHCHVISSSPWPTLVCCLIAPNQNSGGILSGHCTVGPLSCVAIFFFCGRQHMQYGIGGLFGGLVRTKVNSSHFGVAAAIGVHSREFGFDRAAHTPPTIQLQYVRHFSVPPSASSSFVSSSILHLSTASSCWAQYAVRSHSTSTPSFAPSTNECSNRCSDASGEEAEKVCGLQTMLPRRRPTCATLIFRVSCFMQISCFTIPPTFPSDFSCVMPPIIGNYSH